MSACISITSTMEAFTYEEPPSPAPGDRTIVSWDTALHARELSSYSACVVLQVRGESAYLLDVFRDRLEYPELKRKVVDSTIDGKPTQTTMPCS